MKVFISWSKSKSRDFALKTKELIEKANKGVDVFVSETDIIPGEKVQTKILEKIATCDSLIICMTRENKKSPWLLYEAGFANGKDKIVIPMLFDNDPNWHSWIDNPLNVSRELNFNSTDFKSNLRKVFFLDPNADLDYADFLIKNYINDIRKLQDEHRLVPVECEDFVDKLINHKSFLAENPKYLNQEAHFISGFETHELYECLVESFLETGKYLWIYGRKNMKLLSNFPKLFSYIQDASNNSNDSIKGIDFRCLFLDPSYEKLHEEHPDPELLNVELSGMILRAKSKLRENSNLKGSFRMYSHKREEIIIRIDNTILYTRPRFDIYGKPEIITNIGFQVFSVDSIKGQECLNKFLSIWEDSHLLE